jgi:hypothetical protein
MFTNNNIENHMVLSDPPDNDTNEVDAEITVSCCNCSKSSEVSFTINENWSEKELQQEIEDYLWPGKVYCSDCFYQVENLLPKDELLASHLLWELSGYSSPIELYNQAEYEEAQEGWYIDNQIDMAREEELFND